MVVSVRRFTLTQWLLTGQRTYGSLYICGRPLGNIRKLEGLREFELNWPTDPATRPLYVTAYEIPDFR